ncbi:MAG: sugar phosphate nucleotidyltransferase [Brevinema sp.]
MKAFILAAGYGTRNLPATKTIPKELFPLYNRTIMDFILDECEEAGITDLIILTSRRKKVLEDYFDREIELELALTRANKLEELQKINRPTKFNVTFVRQQEMKGTGHAILSAKHLLDQEPFVLFFPDDMIFHHIGATKQLIDIFNKENLSILGARRELENISAYGMIEYKEKNNLKYISNVIEKPKSSEITSDLVSVGRFIYTPEFLHILEKDYQSHITGEFYPMGAMLKLASQQKLMVHELEGTILDTGNHDAYLNTLLEYAYSTDSGKKIIDNFYQNKHNN